jgi:hypothetical protein
MLGHGPKFPDTYSELRCCRLPVLECTCTQFTLILIRTVFASHTLRTFVRGFDINCHGRYHVRALAFTLPPFPRRLI